MTTEQKIKAKMAGRKMADWVFGCIDGDWEDGTGAQYAEAFLDEMRKLLPCKKEDEPKAPEKPEPIARLGRYRLRYDGRTMPLDDIPISFLTKRLWYIEDDTKSIAAYLNHPDIEARRGTE